MITYKAWRLRWRALVGLILVLTLASCQGRAPDATKTTAAPAPGMVADLPVVDASGVVKAAQGGAIALDDGAHLTVPQGALSSDARVTFTSVGSAPIIPVPRALLGRGYDFALDGGELTGVALLTLPLPAEIASPPFDVAPYRWNGKAWERLNGRATPGGIQVGVNRPGVYALQGQWSLADAVVALARSETTPGQQSVPFSVTAQYRYAALPTLQDGHVPARLTLKQDTSGGAGRVTGDETLDKTIDEAQLLLQPDPAHAQGVIDVSHVFQLAPGALELNPGDTTRFYTLLTVRDSAAPTRRVSNGVEYTQLLPIQAVGRAIVRPKLAVEGRQDLRWHILRDGQTLAYERGAASELPFDPFLAQGGLGDYRFTLETQRNGEWVTVSNEVNIKLTVPATPTPPGELVTAPEGTPALVTPTLGTGSPEPVGTPPRPPTRRPTPGNDTGPSATPTAAAVAAVPTATRTRTAAESIFWADRYNLAAGECTNLHWDVQNVISVYFNGTPAEGTETRQICPPQTTTYLLRVNSNSGTQDRTVTLTVGANSTQAGVEFSADRTQLNKGQCTVLHWRALDVRAVYLNNGGVAGESSQQVCPEVTTPYELRVENNDGTTITKRITVSIVPVGNMILRFWADRYSMEQNACITLTWSILDVREVFLDDQPQSGQASTSVCPQPNQSYVLRVIDNSGTTIERRISPLMGTPTLSAQEVIAHGIVNEVVQQIDTDPDQSGDQPGYRLTIDGVQPLYAGTAGWGQAAISLIVLQADMPSTPNAVGSVDWPINPGQQVEFRAFCDGANCTMRTNEKSYLRWRSE
jgi:hypothetical protein